MGILSCNISHVACLHRWHCGLQCNFYLDERPKHGLYKQRQLHCRIFRLCFVLTFMFELFIISLLGFVRCQRALLLVFPGPSFTIHRHKLEKGGMKHSRWEEQEALTETMCDQSFHWVTAAAANLSQKRACLLFLNSLQGSLLDGLYKAKKGTVWIEHLAAMTFHFIYVMQAVRLLIR